MFFKKHPRKASGVIMLLLFRLSMNGSIPVTGSLFCCYYRFGLPMTMVAGLVKKNCSDPQDNGTYCWTEDEKASAIGAFFYTYCLQIVVIWAVVASGLGDHNYINALEHPFQFPPLGRLK